MISSRRRVRANVVVGGAGRAAPDHHEIGVDHFEPGRGAAGVFFHRRLRLGRQKVDPAFRLFSRSEGVHRELPLAPFRQRKIMGEKSGIE